MSPTLSRALPGILIPGAQARLRNELDLRRVWPHFLIWLIVTGCTLGLGWIVVSGHFFRLIINATVIVGADGRRIGRLACDYDVEKRLGHIAAWMAASVATLGIGLLFYSFHAARAALDATTVVWDEP